MDGLEYLTATKDIVVGLSAAFGAFIAWRGLSTWRRQLRGQADFEAARCLARATYKLRHAVQAARVPLVAVQEFPAGYKGDDVSSGEERRSAWAHVYAARWKHVWDGLQEFDAAQLEAEALWGIETRTVTDKLPQCCTDLRLAMQAVIDDEGSKGRNFRSDTEFGQAIRRTAHGTPENKENPFNWKLTDAVMGIEAVLRPHLKRI